MAAMFRPAHGDPRAMNASTMAGRACSNSRGPIASGGVRVSAVTLASVDHCNIVSARRSPSCSARATNHAWASGQWWRAAIPRRRSARLRKSAVMASWPVTISQAANVGAFLVASSCRARDSCAQPPARRSRPQKVRAACLVLRHGVSPAERRAATNRSTWSTAPSASRSGAGITRSAPPGHRSLQTRVDTLRQASRWRDADRAGWIRSTDARPGPGSPPGPCRLHGAA